MILPWKGSRIALVTAAAEKRRFRFILCCTATILSVVFSFLNPQIIRHTIDSVIGNEPLKTPAFIGNLIDGMGGLAVFKNNIWICAVLILGAGLFSASCGIIRRFLSMEIGETAAWKLRNTLYAHIQKLPYDWHIKCQTGDIIQRCTTDIDVIRNFLQQHLSELMRTLCVLAIALIMMFSMDVFMSLMAMSLVPLIIFFSILYFRKVSKEFARADEAEGVMQTAAQENYTGVRVVRAFGREAYEANIFSQKTKTYQNIWIQIGKMLGLFWGAGDFFTGLQLAIVVGAGVWRCITGELSPGTFLAFYTYCNWMIWPIRHMGRILSELSKTLVAAGRVRDILQAEPETDPPDALRPELKGHICFNNVTFGYTDSNNISHKGAKAQRNGSKNAGTADSTLLENRLDKSASPLYVSASLRDEISKPILRNISFSLKPGESLAILGATGSGKSTLVHLISRLYDLQDNQGMITIDGIDIRRIARPHLRRHVGLCLQEPFLFSKTIRENIALSNPCLELEGIKKAAAIAMVDETIEGFAESYNTVIGERGVTLSGGQKQRVAIARMLAGYIACNIAGIMPIMIFDDSLSAVDTETDANIRNALKKSINNAETAKAAVIIISHRISSLMQADKILVLKDGTVEEIGSHEELLAKEGSYRRIFELQKGMNDG